MDATLELTHERVDDVPLLLGFLIKLKLGFRTGVLHFFRGQGVQLLFRVLKECLT